jgi:phosphoglycolate phosphatase-like HAD superfamily hydrolase
LTVPRLSPALEGVDLIVFDKDGTLIDFHAMWGGWANELGRRLEGATRRPVAGDVFAAMGFDPTTGRVRSGAPLAIMTMAEIREVVAAVIRRWCPSIAAARRSVDEAWFVPDPVATAVALTDLPALFGALRDAGKAIAVATTDDRVPTEATLVALGVRQHVAALACGDDGIGVKPDPRMLLAICEAVRVAPQRTAVVGDTVADLTMARAAGSGLAIAVLTGVDRANQLAPLADLVVSSVEDLLAQAP